MRFVIAVLLLIATPVLAAPTCEGRGGQAMHCDTPGAMPLGWTAPLADRNALSADSGDVVEALGLLVLLFALIALLPEFDGSRPEDWEPGNKKDP